MQQLPFAGCKGSFEYLHATRARAYGTIYGALDKSVCACKSEPAGVPEFAKMVFDPTNTFRGGSLLCP